MSNNTNDTAGSHQAEKAVNAVDPLHTLFYSEVEGQAGSAFRLVYSDLGGHTLWSLMTPSNIVLRPLLTCAETESLTQWASIRPQFIHELEAQFYINSETANFSIKDLATSVALTATADNPFYAKSTGDLSQEEHVSEFPRPPLQTYNRLFLGEPLAARGLRITRRGNKLVQSGWPAKSEDIEKGVLQVFRAVADDPRCSWMSRREQYMASPIPAEESLGQPDLYPESLLESLGTGWPQFS